MFKKPKFTPRKILEEWVNDIPDGELYRVFISDEQKVWSTVGRHAHSSGSRSTSWQDFLDGDMNEWVTKTMGQEVLSEVINYLKQQNT
ncbi:hypothetical protein [Zobellella sp. DQSA1]|uniref:hypothetical protein n=1 Tax=Zobellella sp. DQSA1 TaxID=3342386 RepID=UPI0035BFECB6